MKTSIYKCIFCVFAIFALAANISAQTRYPALFSLNTYKTETKPAWLINAVDNALIIDINNSQLQQIITKKEGKITISFPFGNNENAELNLERFDIVDAGSTIVEGTQRGDVPVNVLDKFISYKGKISGIENSLVSVSFFNNGIIGIVTNKNETYVLGKLSGSLANDYVFYRTSKLKLSKDFNCGAEAFEVPEQIKNIQRSLSGNFESSSSTLLRANIAVESDYETFVRYGSVLNATNYLLALMSTVSAVYIRDINVRLFVTYIRVWSVSADPYNGTTSGALLNEFRSYWNANMQGTPRTLAHYISTRPGNLGGIAWLSVLCANLTNGYGYAFSNINGTFNELPVYSWDVDVISHETGHNFGSPHTHNCGWPGGPIDTCYAVEGGCYSGPAIPRVGTIMSYCHLNGGKTLDFGPLPINLIRNNAEAASCLNAITGIFVAKPNGGEILRAGNPFLIVWGTSLTGNVNIDYSVNNGSSWVNIQNNVSATVRSQLWTIPQIPTTTQALMRVSESGNPANYDASDSVFQIRPALQPFNMISPVMFERIYISQNDTSRVLFNWTKAGTLPEIKYRWFINTFSNTPIFNQFSNSSGSDSLLTISKGRLDSIFAAYGVNTGDSIRCKWLARAYTQLDSLSPTTSNFIITFVRGIIGINPISSIIPKEFFVNQNYPNPFNPSTKIKFGIPKNEYVKARVYDIIGREISVLANEQLSAGEYEVAWNADNLPSGIYFVKIETGNNVKILRTVLLK